MPVRSAAWHQSEEISKGLKTLDVVRGVTGVLYLESIQSSGDQRLDPLAPPSFARMGPDGEGARLVRDRDRIFDRKACLGDKRTCSSAQVSHECIAKIMHYASRDQCTRNVRTADRAAIGLLKNFVQRQRNSKHVELVNDLLCTRVPQGTQLTKALFQSVEPRQVQRQDMDFVFVVERTELHPGNYSNSESVTGSARRVDSPNRIMIGECQRRETAAVGGLDYLVGWKNAVGCCRVGMQVDKGRPARIPAHCP